jgi:hypothetical protein
MARLHPGIGPNDVSADTAQICARGVTWFACGRANIAGGGNSDAVKK